MNAKYHSDIPLEFVLSNATFRVLPAWAFGLEEDDFTGSPTRWEFSEG